MYTCIFHNNEAEYIPHLLPLHKVKYNESITHQVEVQRHDPGQGWRDQGNYSLVSSRATATE